MGWTPRLQDAITPSVATDGAGYVFPLLSTWLSIGSGTTKPELNQRTQIITFSEAALKGSLENISFLTDWNNSENMMLQSLHPSSGFVGALNWQGQIVGAYKGHLLKSFPVPCSKYKTCCKSSKPASKASWGGEKGIVGIVHVLGSFLQGIR